MLAPDRYRSPRKIGISDSVELIRRRRLREHCRHGVASASYCWSRMSSSLGPSSQDLAGNRANTWHMLVADDFHLEVSGHAYRDALLSCSAPYAVFHCRGMKLQGGLGGFELLHRSHQPGTSQRRADWFVSGGRSGVREHDLLRRRTWTYHVRRWSTRFPFLGLIYKFMILHRRGSTCKVPPHIQFILRFLSQRIQESRRYPCVTSVHSSGTAFQVDAQASEGRTGIGLLFRILDRQGLQRCWTIATVLS